MANYNINPDDERIAIPNSKLKTFLIMLGALAFVALGVVFITHPETFEDSYIRRPKIEILFIGYLSVVFFGLCAIGAVFILFSNKPALIIDDKGVAITSGFGPPNLISWFDIKDFQIGAVNNVAFIYIQLNDADKFISEQKNAWRRRIMSLSYKQFGAPLSISTTALKCDFNQLFDLLCDRLKDFKAAERSTHFTG